MFVSMTAIRYSKPIWTKFGQDV